MSLHARASAAGSARAFSLLELLAVLAVIAAVVGLVAPSVGRSAARAERRAQVRGVFDVLAAARAEAMDRSRPELVVLAWGGGPSPAVFSSAGSATEADGLRVLWSGGERAWSPLRSRVSIGRAAAGRETADRGGTHEVVFDEEGRTAAAALVFRPAKDGSGPAWRLAFDRITGRPTLGALEADGGGVE